MLLKTLAREHERFRQEGRLEGLQEGLEEGRQEGFFNGLFQAITTLLTSKFGHVEADLEQAIAGLHDVTALQETLEAIVQADTLDQVTEFVAAARKSLHN